MIPDSALHETRAPRRWPFQSRGIDFHSFFVLVYLFGLDTCLLYFICALLLDGEIYTVSTVVDEEEILFKEKVASVWTSRTGVITCTYVITGITSGGRI
jgi:hypothetical protein